MGKNLFLVGVFMVGIVAVAFAAPALADDSIDPMVWPKHQWRSDLFAGAAHDPRARLRHAHRHEMRIVRVETNVVSRSPGGRLPPSPRRAKLIRIGGDVETGVAVNPYRDNRPQCSGMLILTWTGSETTSRCHYGNATRRD